MSVFIEAPFWSSRSRMAYAPHMRTVVVVEPTVEPITLDEAKARARIDVPDENGLLAGFIRAARAQVEFDTGLALFTQTRDVYLDGLAGAVVQLPAQCQPLQSVTSIKSTDTSDVQNTLATTNYVVDTASGRIGLSLSGAWPTDLRPFQPFVIRVVAGWTAVASIPPLLVHAVGLLTAHYATLGRDLASLEPTTETCYGYDAAIAPYRLVMLA